VLLIFAENENIINDWEGTMFNFEELKKLDEKQKLAVHCL
jgi:hypothetical protein